MHVVILANYNLTKENKNEENNYGTCSYGKYDNNGIN